RRQPAAGTAMQEHCGLGAGRADALPIDAVAVADVEMAGGVGFDLRVEAAQVAHAGKPPFGGHSEVSWSGCWRECREALNACHCGDSWVRTGSSGSPSKKGSLSLGFTCSSGAAMAGS